MGDLTTGQDVDIISPLPAGTNLVGKFVLADVNGDSCIDAALDAAQTSAVPSAASTKALSNKDSTAYEASNVIKASVGRLYTLNGYNSAGVEQFIQVHNASSLPADGSVPVVVFTVPATTNFSLDYGVYGRYFATGIVVCNSSTGATKTIGSANCWFSATYL